MSDSNIIEGRFPVRRPVIVKADEPERRSLSDLAFLAGLTIPRTKIDTGEVVALSEALDDAARSARGLMHKSGRAAFCLVAQDLESLSERLVILAAELGHTE